MTRWIRFIVPAVVALSACDRLPEDAGVTGPDAQMSRVPPAQKIGAGVLEALARGETPAIIVSLDAGSPRGLGATRNAVAAAQSAALTRVAPGEFSLRRRFAAVPALAGVAHSEAALRRLAADPRVRRIDLDEGGSGGLVSSVPLIRGDLRHTRGNTGAGVVVAILDTGFDSDHPDLQGALVGEACFGRDASDTDGVGFCPDGTDRQTGLGSAEDDQRHGTHVTGIVTANGTDSGPGVAPDASILAIKVLDSGGAAGRFFFLSEIVAALDYIVNNPGFGVQVVNASLGTSTQYAGECDEANAGAQAMRDVVDLLWAAGVIVFSSAGNNGGSMMGIPACISTVISVGASTATDTRAGFSDVNETTDIFAPGVAIVSSRMGGGSVSLQGTSMASPHAAGCAALLIQSGDATTPAAIEARLKSSAFTVTVGDLTFPRIDCGPDDNQAPAVAADNAAIAPDEGSLATNSGTYSDPDGDDVALSASIGSVVAHGDGTWTWSFATTDGPAETQQVTITATDGPGDASSVNFTMNVLNVAPTVDAGPDASITSDEEFEFSGTFSDPGVIDNPWQWVIDWGDGTETSGNTSDQSAPITRSHQFCAAQDYTIALQVTDKDGGVGIDQLTLTVQYLGIDIDITPTGSPNSVNLRDRGRLPVAILSSSTFDATTVDPATVVLGDEAGTDTPVAARPNGRLFAAVEDVNGDGLPDLVLHFSVPALVANGDLTAGSTHLVLRGFMQDGCTNFRGQDSVNIVP
ncbi:MAG TPA: S8 family serine peptidase [Longimicrobiales bacterium]|nr:S8 family serine peptidase [Longimicrobiales bacterium]